MNPVRTKRLRAWSTAARGPWRSSRDVGRAVPAATCSNSSRTAVIVDVFMSVIIAVFLTHTIRKGSSPGWTDSCRGTSGVLAQSRGRRIRPHQLDGLDSTHYPTHYFSDTGWPYP